MKRNRFFIVILMAFIAVVALTACDHLQHNYTWKYNDEYHYKECSCGERTNREKHRYNNYDYDDTYHWAICVCGKTQSREKHEFSIPVYDEGYHWRECSCGLRIDLEQHNISTQFSADRTRHWHSCECGYITDESEHVMEEEIIKEPSCTEEGSCKYTCAVCNNVYYDAIEKLPHVYGVNVTQCKICSQPRPKYVIEDQYIYFGEYPQTRVTDTALIDKLNSLEGELPNVDDEGSWHDYGYYIKDNVQSYMWYKDVEYSYSRYRAVYFTQYRPSNTNYESGTENSYQDDNGYFINNVYWFKYEPVKWRILTRDNDKALIMCDIIIDTQAFQSNYYIDGYIYYTGSIDDEHRVYANNYVHSSIRQWLNESFYNQIFDEFDKESVLRTEIDNLAVGGVSGYDDVPTQDNVFLLGNSECIKEEYGFNFLSGISESRQMKTSDYSKAMGIFTESKDANLIGNAWWMTRSPIQMSSAIRGVNQYGMSSADYPIMMLGGVVPVVTLNL